MPPPPSLQWLHTLKSADLQRLAAAIGTNTTGTKPALITSLQSNLPTSLFPPSPHKPHKTKHDLISIDMGIRNLAYCRIHLPPTWPAPTPTPSSLPTITDWARISISSKPTPQNPPTDTALMSKTNPPPPKPEPFDHPTLSRHAYALATHLLSPQPTQILIERQRFRSMGGAAVQEWTLRVNTFEAMMYAVLRTLGEVGRWSGGAGGEKGVCAVEPGKVARFWVEDEEGEEREGGKVGKKGVGKGPKNKVAKIRVVEGWLEKVLEGRGEGRFRLEGNARGLGQGFLRKRRGGRDVRVWQEGIGGVGCGEAEIGKLDDLADALLQGMAWVKWEENRRRVMEDGIAALASLR